MVRRWAIGRKESDRNCPYFVPNSINTLFCILYKLQTQRMHCDGARSPPVSCGAFASVIAQSEFCATKKFACSSYGCFVFCYYEWGKWALWWLRFLFGELFTHHPTPPSSAPFSPTWRSGWVRSSCLFVFCFVFMLLSFVLFLRPLLFSLFDFRHFVCVFVFFAQICFHPIYT